MRFKLTCSGSNTVSYEPFKRDHHDILFYIIPQAFDNHNIRSRFIVLVLQVALYKLAMTARIWGINSLMTTEYRVDSFARSANKFKNCNNPEMSHVSLSSLINVCNKCITRVIRSGPYGHNICTELSCVYDLFVYAYSWDTYVHIHATNKTTSKRFSCRDSIKIYCGAST